MVMRSTDVLTSDRRIIAQLRSRYDLPTTEYTDAVLLSAYHRWRQDGSDEQAFIGYARAAAIQQEEKTHEVKQGVQKPSRTHRA